MQLGRNMRTIRPPERVVFTFLGAKLRQSAGRYWEFEIEVGIVRWWVMEFRWWVLVVIRRLVAPVQMWWIFVCLELGAGGLERNIG